MERGNELEESSDADTSRIAETILEYLSLVGVVQLATVSTDGTPWVCSVYGAVDGKTTCLYWLSLPSRRHSKELMSNPNASICLVLEAQLPVVGLQIEGVVKVVSDSDTVRTVMEDYASRHDTGKSYADRFEEGCASHVLYQFTPSRFSLFDERNFPYDSPKEWTVEA